jgi:replicative DNA helicase Mcm
MSKQLRAKAAEFIQVYCNVDELITRQYEGHPTLDVSMMDLSIYSHDLTHDLITAPDTLLPIFERVLHNYAETLEAALDVDDVSVTPAPDRPETPEAGDEPLIPADTEIRLTEPTSDVFHAIGAPRDEKIDKLVAFEGTVKQLSDNKPRIVETRFACDRCGTKSDYIDLSDTFDLEEALPHECAGCDRQGPFSRLHQEERREEYQQIRLQEPPGEAVNEASPREVIGDVMGDHLIDQTQPGDRITLIGVLREDGDTDSTLVDTRLEVLSVIPEEVQFEEVNFDEKDVERIEEIAASPELFDHVTESVAPSIYGNEEAKLGVALQMFGGVSRRVHGNRKRGEIHIMFIGDPGVGKSQILESARTLAPRSVSSSGTGASSVGLTASAQKEKIGGEEEWTLQAGSLVLADGGMITIDELDNMEFREQQALDEALSEGRISVDKANVHATLKARCSALMAANPEYGRFDPYEPLQDQFDMPSELLDRCDLVFPFRDVPDDDLDAAIIDTVLDTHSAEPAAADGGLQAVEEAGFIDADLFRKYVAYARRNYDPNLSDEAKKSLKNWYLEIRSKSDPEEMKISINTRLFEGAVRLAEASARARLSETVSVADAERAAELVRHMLNEIGTDPESGNFDVDVVSGGRSSTQRQRVKVIENTIDDLAREQGEAPTRADVLNELDDRDADKIDNEIDRLKEEGELYEPQEGRLRVS